MEEVNWWIQTCCPGKHWTSLPISLVAWKNKAAGNSQASGEFIQAIAEANHNRTKVKEETTCFTIWSWWAAITHPQYNPEKMENKKFFFLFVDRVNKNLTHSCVGKRVKSTRVNSTCHSPLDRVTKVRKVRETRCLCAKEGVWIGKKG